MKVTLHCTDRNQTVEADVLQHKAGTLLEVALNTVKIRMIYNRHNRVYVGSMAGLEFTVKEDNVPTEYSYKEYRRTR